MTEICGIVTDNVSNYTVDLQQGAGMTKADKDMIDRVSIWFEVHKDDTQIWRTPFGSFLKLKLKSRGNWKGAPRGNPEAYKLKSRKFEEGE